MAQKDCSMRDPKYHVAISYHSADEKIADALSTQLSRNLDVFFYPRRQEDLAGTDGLESMREPFLNNSRIVVVLFNGLWGKTPWTGVEQTAIKDRCLNDQFTSLFFLVLSKSAELPSWLPETHVRFLFEDYGLEQAIGAIKARVQAKGGRFRVEDAMSRAREVQREIQYLEEKRRRFWDGRWIHETVHERLGVVLKTAAGYCKKAADETQLPLRAGVTNRGCVMTNNKVSLHAGWHQDYANHIENAYLSVAAFDGQLELPGESLIHVWQNPQRLRTWRFNPDLNADLELCWIEDGSNGERFTDDALAERLAKLFFELVSSSLKR